MLKIDRANNLLNQTTEQMFTFYKHNYCLYCQLEVSWHRLDRA